MNFSYDVTVSKPDITAVEFRRGKGDTDEDPIRVVTAYFDADHVLLWENDPVPSTSTAYDRDPLVVAAYEVVRRRRGLEALEDTVEGDRAWAGLLGAIGALDGVLPKDAHTMRRVARADQ